jgi:hypothetical protein
MMHHSFSRCMQVRTRFWSINRFADTWREFVGDKGMSVSVDNDFSEVYITGDNRVRQLEFTSISHRNALIQGFNQQAVHLMQFFSALR